MNNSTRTLISTFGAFTGLMGIEHGLGEALQGNVSPNGFIFPSWPDSTFFQILGGEPAMSIIPNMLITGILAILASLAYLTAATVFVERKYSSLALILFAMLMLLVGGGIFPPVLGILIGAGASRINKPLYGLRKLLPPSTRRLLGTIWPWAFGAALLSWLAMFPGVPILSYFFGVENEALILALLACMFGFLILSGITGLILDSREKIGAFTAA